MKLEKLKSAIESKDIEKLRGVLGNQKSMKAESVKALVRLCLDHQWAEGLDPLMPLMNNQGMKVSADHWMQLVEYALDNGTDYAVNSILNLKNFMRWHADLDHVVSVEKVLKKALHDDNKARFDRLLRAVKFVNIDSMVVHQMCAFKIKSWGPKSFDLLCKKSESCGFFKSLQKMHTKWEQMRAYSEGQNILAHLLPGLCREGHKEGVNHILDNYVSAQSISSVCVMLLIKNKHPDILGLLFSKWLSVGVDLWEDSVKSESAIFDLNALEYKDIFLSMPKSEKLLTEEVWEKVKQSEFYKKSPWLGLAMACEQMVNQKKLLSEVNREAGKEGKEQNEGPALKKIFRL